MEEKLLVDIAKDLTIAMLQDPRREGAVDALKLYGRFFKKVLACYAEEYQLKERLEEGQLDEDPFAPDEEEQDAELSPLDPDDAANEEDPGDEVVDLLES